MTEQKEIIINGKPVELKGEYYSYFACTCSDKDTEYWNKMIDKIFEQQKVDDRSSALAYHISHCFDGSVTSIYADMWMGVGVEIGNGKFKMNITCDQLQYGLAAAIVIASKLDSENAKEYDLENLLD